MSPAHRSESTIMKLQTVIMCSLAAATLAGTGAAQTRVDLRTQGKSVDFSSANSTSPSKTGTQLPAACQIGATFVKTDAPAGQNWYVCTSANIWTAQGIELPPQAGMASLLGDFTVTRTSGTVLSIGTNCSAATPCNVRFGNQVYAVTSSATATLVSGSGTAYVYADSAGNLTVQTALSLSCSGACVATSSGTGFPANSIPLYTWTATIGAWDAGGGVDRRGWLSSTNLLAGAGIMTVQSGGQTTIAVDAAVVPTYLTGSATLDFPSVPAGACSADQTFALPGASVGNGVVPGWPSGLEAGLNGLMRVSAPGIVAVRLCASSAAAVDPASAGFTATIVRGY